MAEQGLRIAAFVTEVLGLEDDPSALAADLRALKQDTNAAIYTVELDSSVGPAAFLIYVYQLGDTGDDGRSGRQLLDADLATLELAAARDTPGPRLLAHALSDEEGFILATTPATFRALTGESGVDLLQATSTDLLPVADPVETRRIAAGELLQLLRAADAQAAAWLTAIQAEGPPEPESGDPETAVDELLFTPEETELALFLLDERSIQQLLRVLNLMIAAARHSVADATGGDTAP